MLLPETNDCIFRYRCKKQPYDNTKEFNLSVKNIPSINQSDGMISVRLSHKNILSRLEEFDKLILQSKTKCLQNLTETKKPSRELTIVIDGTPVVFRTSKIVLTDGLAGKPDLCKNTHAQIIPEAGSGLND